jgi:hypothetical protein
MELELANKTWVCKKILPASFPNCLLESVGVESTFPYTMSPRHEEVKQNTIGVAGRTSAKLPHCIGPTLAYPMKNEMPFVHHIVKQCEYNYTNEDGKGLSERTQGHLMVNPKFKLM